MKRVFQYLLFVFAIPVYANAEPIELDQVISYLNSIETLGADFGQVNHDGSTSKGVLYIKKPGRLRMVYASPDTTVVIVNNEFVTILDARNSASYQKLSISNNPLRLLLSSELELNLEESIIDFNSSNLKTTIIVSDKKNTDQGALEIILNNKPLIFEKWVLTNSFNEKIVVNLSNILVGDEFKDSLFDPVLEINKSTNKP